MKRRSNHEPEGHGEEALYIPQQTVEPALCPAMLPGQQKELGEEAREKCACINF